MADRKGIFASAFLCEKVLSERSSSNNSIHSAIRIVDTFTLRLPEAADVDAQATVVVPLEVALFVSIKSETPRDGEVSVVLETPDGKTLTSLGPFPVSLKGASHGHYLKTPIAIHAGSSLLEGVYWFNVFWGEDLIQHVPMTFKREQIALGSGSQMPKQTPEGPGHLEGQK